MGVGVALDLGPHTTTMTRHTAVGVGVALGLRTPHTLIPPAGKAHRSYTSFPHITILILLILHTVKTHILHLCLHITKCVLVVVSVLMLLCVVTVSIQQASLTQGSQILVHRRARRMPNQFMI